MSGNNVDFPGMVPDYLDAFDEDEGRARGEYGMGWVHHSLLLGYAGDCAIFAAQADEPSDKALWQRRERWFDEIAKVVQRFCPDAEPPKPTLKRISEDGAKYVDIVLTDGGNG